MFICFLSEASIPVFPPLLPFMLKSFHRSIQIKKNPLIYHSCNCLGGWGICVSVNFFLLLQISAASDVQPHSFSSQIQPVAFSISHDEPLLKSSSWSKSFFLTLLWADVPEAWLVLLFKQKKISFFFTPLRDRNDFFWKFSVHLLQKTFDWQCHLSDKTHCPLWKVS